MAPGLLKLAQGLFNFGPDFRIGARCAARASGQAGEALRSRCPAEAATHRKSHSSRPGPAQGSVDHRGSVMSNLDQIALSPRTILADRDPIPASNRRGYRALKVVH